MSFYRNFDFKDDILVKYISSITYDFIRNENCNYSDSDLKEYIIKLFRHLGKNRALCCKLYKADKLHLIKDMFDEVFITCKRYNEYKAYYISGSLYNVFYCRIRNNFKELPEEIADLITG